MVRQRRETTNTCTITCPASTIGHLIHPVWTAHWQDEHYLATQLDIYRQQKSHPFGVAFSSQSMALVFRRERHGLSEWSECFTWHRPIFSGGYPPNIVGATAFHSRVRDGSEWFHCAMDTRIGIRSQVNPENCIGYELISRLLTQA